MQLIKKFQDANLILIGIALSLFIIGLVGLSSIAVHHEYLNKTSPFIKQSIFFLPGIILFFIMFYLPKSFYHKSAYWIYGFSILSVSIPFIGKTIAGTYRWLDFGFIGIQPSEYAKWIVVIVLARYLSDNNLNLKKMVTLIVPILLALIPATIVLRQPDLGSAIIILSPLIPMIYWSGVRPYFIFLLIAPLISILTAFHPLSFTVWGILMLVIFYLSQPTLASGVISYFSYLLLGLLSPWLWSLLNTYQQRRIITMFNPELDPLGSAYQVIQSQTAIGAGGFWGKGWGQGTQTHLKFLPVQESDFIISVLGEELGFGFLMILFFLFAFLIYGIVQLAYESNDRFSSLVLIGIGTILFSHFFVNTAMAVGLTPVKGLPLPFISAGGSFLLSCFMMLGLIVNMGRNTFE